MRKYCCHVLCILLTAAALLCAAACAAQENGRAPDLTSVFAPAPTPDPITYEELPTLSGGAQTPSTGQATETLLTPASTASQTETHTSVTPTPTETPVTPTPTETPVTPTPTETPLTPTFTETPVTQTPTETPVTPTPTETPVTPTPTETPVTPTPTETPVTPTPTETPITPTPTKTPSTYQPAAYTPFIPEDKIVAFTFDDGPDLWTGELLDVIDGTDDKITFFVTGYMMDRSKDFATPYEAHTRRALEMGCEVGLHCYYHQDVVYSTSKQTDCTDEVFKREIIDLDAKYRALFGRTPQLFRPMGGNYNPMRDYGYTTVLWSVDSNDWKTFDDYRKNGLLSDDPAVKAAVTEQAVNEIVDRILSQLQSGDIVLMHDIYYISRLAFEKVYHILKEQGYRFVTVSELLGIDPAEHHGQYFYSTYYYGYMGQKTELKTPIAHMRIVNAKKKKDE